MNEFCLVNNILIKNVIARRYTKCIYKNSNENNNSIILYFYKLCKKYKELINYEYLQYPKKKLHISYTNDKDKKINNIKNRIIKRKVICNFRLLIFLLFVLILVYFGLINLFIYDNNNNIECKIQFTECPIILHEHVNNFLKSYKINNLKKEQIAAIYKFMNNKNSENGENIIGSYLDNEKKDEISGGINNKRRKKFYKILNDEKINCKNCNIVFKILKNNETIEDILNFEENNKCMQTMDINSCVNVKNGVIKNKKIHIYKKYTGPIRDSNYFEKIIKHKKIFSNEHNYSSYMDEKIIIGDNIKYIYPFMNDYVLNLDWFKFYDENGKEIPVNTGQLEKLNFVEVNGTDLCRSFYKQKYRDSTFFWMCSDFYKNRKSSEEYMISKMIEEILNFKESGYSQKNKHIIEMSKFSPTKSTYKHFGYISTDIKLPINIGIYNRFKLIEADFLINEMIDDIYRALFSINNKELEIREKNKSIFQSEVNVLHTHICEHKLAFFGHKYVDVDSKEKAEENKVEIDKENVENIIDKENCEITIYEKCNNKKGKPCICRKLWRKFGNWLRGCYNKIIKSCISKNIEIKKKDVINLPDKKEGTYVLIEEIENEKKNIDGKNGEKINEEHIKELVIISSSIFFGKMKILLKISIVILIILFLITIFLIIFYIYLINNKDVSMINIQDNLFENIPRYLKCGSKNIANASISDAEKKIFISGKHRSYPF
ncbi:conserved Plasmodium protein, unknown function [Plasmodium berghei]|uniref:Uncharacterized protein n=2 Tax=Plasmodium berghei TaxID=5821 RepID=A0A509AHH4_PLABA|nr:conserved Plasmodium protein, unknown function [Plasmodium berghei ANKA]CXI36803.1 conserved Plasmodium protein, unknown function [Plasmodium berghei]SCM21623.1 conserved Plasmodium protein, unknown function [Plasmodium berghei]SCN24825.1 conserved Plasmodium protein, unknown function [Plasmodium berghei]SCO59945.1 conserved Plasmodium protein, unknown function [Plasmodium berghei]SCO61312.1 conserved Plasmodium protein, unknown function [Plasmodium berghei]|eukprot:XP_034421313.1 conserved Plasmodium protein, unknown function [Plasmodium berghei ANKA]